MEEEGNRRKGFLVGVNEEDEDDEDAIMVDYAKQREANGNARGVDPRNIAYSNRDAGRAGPRDRGDGKRNFELNMGAATLLGRRHKTPPDVHMATAQRVPIDVEMAS